MKTGKTLQQLAQSLIHVKENSRDFIVPTKSLKAVAGHNAPIELMFDDHTFRPTTWAHSQISQFTGIPKAYYDKLIEENPLLLNNCINHGFTTKSESSRLIRTVDGNMRGLLSSRYRILDAHDLLETVYPTLERLDMNIVASEITEQRMYIKCLSNKLMSEVKKGDVVQRGLVISTSDVGSGSLRIEPLIYRLVCLNGMISNTAFKKYHVGKNQHEDIAMELLSDRTKSLTDMAFWAQVRDIVSNSMRPELFNAEVDALYNASNVPLKGDVSKVVELSMKAVGITGEAKKESILTNLASGNQGAGYTLYGLANSFTAAAKEDRFSWEESIELERAGGQIIELNKSQYKQLAA